MKLKDIIWLVVIIAAIGVTIGIVVKKIKDAAQNAAANNLPDWIGVRSTEAKQALTDLKKMKYLTHSWVVSANAKYNTVSYQIINYLDTSMATNIAKAIITSNSVLPFDWLDDSKNALDAIQSIKNQVQAAQVTESYYNSNATRKKDFGKGLGWMDNEQLVEAAKHLANLPTGVFKDGKELTNLTI